MDPFSSLFSLMGEISKVGELDSTNYDEMRKALNGTKSITERARKSFFIYPVIYTPGVCGDVDTVLKINKFLEIQYAIFTMMTVGLSPVADGNNVTAILNNVSTESFEINTPDESEISERVRLFNEANPKAYEEYVHPKKFSLEDNTNTGNNNTTIKKEEITTDFGENLKDRNIDVSNSISIINKSLEKANPSVFDISVYLGSGDKANKVSIPIAIKTNPHFVREDEFVALFDSAIEDKRLLTRIIKLTSGEISFFKDFLFNMDRINRDKKLLVKFGQHPWYQQFIARKEMNGVKKAAIVLSHVFNKFKPFVSGMSNFLPTATIVASVSEMEHGTKMKYSFLLKNEKYIWEVLNRLSLLCICVYDEQTGFCKFYFNGFKKPLTIHTKEMSKSGSDSTAELAKAMNTMLKRGIM